MPEDTQLYKWAGLDKQGKRVHGVIPAANLKEAQAELKKLSIEIVSLEKKAQLFFSLKRDKIKSKDILLFTRYLSTMISSGLPILQALDAIGREGRFVT